MFMQLAAKHSASNDTRQKGSCSFELDKHPHFRESHVDFSGQYKGELHIQMQAQRCNTSPQVCNPHILTSASKLEQVVTMFRCRSLCSCIGVMCTATASCSFGGLQQLLQTLTGETFQCIRQSYLNTAKKGHDLDTTLLRPENKCISPDLL